MTKAYKEGAPPILGIATGRVGKHFLEVLFSLLPGETLIEAELLHTNTLGESGPSVPLVQRQLFQ